MPHKAAKLGILAGGGDLPRQLIETCRKSGRDVFVIAFNAQCDAQTVEGVDHAWVNIGKAGKSIELLRANNVEELVMAGRIEKPSMAQLMPDARALKVLASGVLHMGDDSLLSAIVQMLEHEEGFRMVGVHDVMPELLAPEGVLGRIQPSADDRVSVQTAIKAALDLGAQDIGQAAVARGEQVIARENRSGTDSMLNGLKGNAYAHGAVLAKMMKPNQEARVDLPTIGVDTVLNAAAAGLCGIVVHAGASLIIDRAAVIEAANSAGLFLLGAKS